MAYDCSLEDLLKQLNMSMDDIKTSATVSPVKSLRKHKPRSSLVHLDESSSSQNPKTHKGVVNTTKSPAS